MYEDRTQNYGLEIDKEYLIHDTRFPLPHHLWPCADYSIAMNTANYTERQQFSAVTVSLRSGFSRFF